MNIYIQKLLSVCNSNKYTKWYVSIVSNPSYTNGYSELHHILPKSFNLGGETDQLNLVRLTAREHYICHLLLPKMLNDEKLKSKMSFALKRMMMRDLNSKSYQLIRMAKAFHTEETKQKLRKPKNTKKARIIKLRLTKDEANKSRSEKLKNISKKRVSVELGMLTKRAKLKTFCVTVNNKVLEPAINLKDFAEKYNIPHNSLYEMVRRTKTYKHFLFAQIG